MTLFVGWNTVHLGTRDVCVHPSLAFGALVPALRSHSLAASGAYPLRWCLRFHVHAALCCPALLSGRTTHRTLRAYRVQGLVCRDQAVGLTCVLVCAQEHGRDDFGRIPGCRPARSKSCNAGWRRQNPNQMRCGKRKSTIRLF